MISLMLGAALLATAATPADGQAPDATIDVTVRYPNGALVTDYDVCLLAEGSGALGATASIPAFSGGTYNLRVGGSCLNATNPLPTLTWHNGQPASGFSQVWSELIELAQPIEVQPGSNEVTVTVGAARLSGTVTGTAPLEPSECVVNVVGTSAISGDLGPITVLPEANGSWEAWVHPGDYTVEVSCLLRAAFEAWPNQSRVGDATSINLVNGQQRTGINFNMEDRIDETTGANLLVVFETTEEFRLPKCVEAYALDGTLVRRGFSTSVGIADNGSYRLRVTDCFNLGFADQWFPAGASQTAGPSITVDGSEVETGFPAAPIGGGVLDCNGLEITIRGTTADDVIEGTPGPDVISSLGGDDTILALGGDDTVCAGPGNDLVEGNAGADWIDGGTNDDLLRGGWGEDAIYGGDGDDFIRSFKHDDFVDGGAGDDIIRGGWGSDVLRGGPGDDRIIAWNGADRIFGNAGNDVLRAGPGPDYVVGGPGLADRIFGDEGTKDTCFDVGAMSVFDGCETINGE